MGWESRTTGLFYYKSQRIGDQVRKIYLGRGYAAQLAASLDAESRARRASAKTILSAYEAAIAPAERATSAFERSVKLLRDANLTAAGFRRHHHGQWTRPRP